MITAIILAAGESRRMGEPKMLMPWGTETVLGHVVSTLYDAGLEDQIVVTGGARAQVENLLGGIPTVRTAFNPDFEQGEMLSSVQCGLRAAGSGTRAALICLGDQPQVREETVRRVCAAFERSKSGLIVPSYRMRRGHPWLAPRRLWDNLLEMKPPSTPRDFLNSHSGEIEYVELDSPSVIEDLDTPEDHRKFNPRTTAGS